MRPLVLAIEDDDAQRLVMQLSLQELAREQGFDLEVAADLREARRVELDGRSVLVLSDANLPDGDGIAFLDDVHRSGLEGVVLTASTNGRHSDRYRMVEKHFDLNEHRAWLRDVVQDWMERTNATA